MVKLRSKCLYEGKISGTQIEEVNYALQEAKGKIYTSESNIVYNLIDITHGLHFAFRNQPKNLIEWL